MCGLKIELDLDFRLGNQCFSFFYKAIFFTEEFFSQYALFMYRDLTLKSTEKKNKKQRVLHLQNRFL